MSKRHRPAFWLGARDAHMRAARNFRYQIDRSVTGNVLHPLDYQVRMRVQFARNCNHLALKARRAKGGVA